MKLDGKTFFITGGASGLGEATARLFASEGANVVIADLNAKKGKAVAESLGNQAIFVKVDVVDEKSVEAVVQSALDRFGALHGAVNCAGVGYPRRIVSKSGKVHPLKPFQMVININLIGTFNVLRLTAKAMTKNQPEQNTGERGVLINVASVAAFDGQIGQAAYSASKAGVCGMTLPIARDLGVFGIRICTVAPGIFETSMTAAMPPVMKKGLENQAQFPKRLGQAPEFAHLAKCIVENSYLNGEVIRLDAATRMTPK